MSGDVWLGLAESGCVGPWIGPGLPNLPDKGSPFKASRITHDTMILEVDNRVVATTWLSEHAAANGNRVDHLG